MIQRILTVPDERLTQVCEPVEDFGSERLADLVRDLFDTMYAAGGIGLAAPQIGVLERVFVMDVREGKKEHNPVAFINPEILVMRGECEEEEGCLSIPNTFGNVKRPWQVSVAAKSLDGSGLFLTFRGLEARCICHESDHLNGILFVDRALAYAGARD